MIVFGANQNKLGFVRIQSSFICEHEILNVVKAVL